MVIILQHLVQNVLAVMHWYLVVTPAVLLGGKEKSGVTVTVFGPTTNAEKKVRKPQLSQNGLS